MSVRSCITMSKCVLRCPSVLYVIVMSKCVIVKPMCIITMPKCVFVISRTRERTQKYVSREWYYNVQVHFTMPECVMCHCNVQVCYCKAHVCYYNANFKSVNRFMTSTKKLCKAIMQSSIRNHDMHTLAPALEREVWR